jgi:hypothetical protein
VSRATRDTGSKLYSCQLRDFHPLRSAFPDRFVYKYSSYSPGPTTPLIAERFRLFPFRSPLLRKSFLLSLPGATEMFQFTPFTPLRVPDLPSGGLPHSDTPGSLLAYNSPGLFAVRRVLPRLTVLRHPPYALTYFHLVLLRAL